MAPKALTWFRRGDHAEIQLPSDTVAGAAESIATLLDSPALAGAEVRLVSDLDDSSGPGAAPVAAAAGFHHERTILRLRRSLPVSPDDSSRIGVPYLDVRPFRPDDAAAWISVNNRAFVDHPDQGAESPATLADRLAEPWFTPDGFLVVDDTDAPGSLAGFCWTKVHPATESAPAIGEIYVIGADPRHQGRGVGAALVLAGLDHLAGLGLTLAELFVEDDNTPARNLYDRLGFQIHGRREVYAR